MSHVTILRADRWLEGADLLVELDLRLRAAEADLLAPMGTRLERVSARSCEYWRLGSMQPTRSTTLVRSRNKWMPSDRRPGNPVEPVLLGCIRGRVRWVAMLSKVGPS